MNNHSAYAGLLACPLDRSALVFQPAAEGHPARWLCANGHCFDVARQGYANLLVVQDKRSRDPGDSKEMVSARQRLLASGVYAGIARQLEAIVLDCANQVVSGSRAASPMVLLDAGCGEGYYLEHCLNALRSVRPALGIGLDISKWAIQPAARRRCNAIWLVGSNRNPPLQDASVDLIVCGFGFPDFRAFRRLLKPGGMVILLDPVEGHLVELRRIIYPQLKPYRENHWPEAVDAGFREYAHRHYCETGIKLGQQQIHDIMVMSPHFYRASPDGRKAALALEQLDITLDVSIRALSVA